LYSDYLLSSSGKSTATSQTASGLWQDENWLKERHVDSGCIWSRHAVSGQEAGPEYFSQVGMNGIFCRVSGLVQQRT
ncbi:hypothetical protein, partial [Endozoicomonas sp. ALC013]|uniref:hypothetical protein n=1 Tax=Endozoicomonas sp. ALC013 TaxID=3403076 RepID=UPI003BB4D188